eukprot:257847_1
MFEVNMSSSKNIHAVNMLLVLICILSPSDCQPWRRVFKINRGVGIPGSQTPAQWYEAYTEYSYADMTGEEGYINGPEGTSLTIDSNFKSRLIKDWVDKVIIVNKVRLLFCRNGNIEKEVVFNATTSTYNNWLTPPKIESSSYTDLTPSMSYTANYVGIAIPSWPDRTFGFWKNAPSCAGDEGWFVVTVYDACGDAGEWGETEFTPNIKYSGLDTAGVFQTDGVTGETFIMEILIDQPTTQPTAVPSFIPTVNPTYIPTTNPTYEPTSEPTTEPTTIPTNVPTSNPSKLPTTIPTNIPTIFPTFNPTQLPTFVPTFNPTTIPTNYPTFQPTFKPTTDDGVASEKTTADISITNDGKNTEKLSFLFKGNVLILLIVICILTCIVCIMFIIYCGVRRAGHRNEQNKVNMEKSAEGMELTRVTSVTHSKNNETTTMMNGEDETLRQWLLDINCVQYYDLFRKHEYDLHTLEGINDDRLLNIGINKLAHRKTILLKVQDMNVENDMNAENDMDDDGLKDMYDVHSGNENILTKGFDETPISPNMETPMISGSHENVASTLSDDTANIITMDDGSDHSDDGLYQKSNNNVTEQ